MVYISDTSITGQFASIYALTAPSTPFTSAVLQSIANPPRANIVYPANQLFKVFDRTKKVFDQTKQPSSFTVYNNAGAVGGQNYSIFYNGYVFFPAGAQAAAGGTANEVQTITSTATGGTIALTFDDGTGNPQKTAPIAYNATAAAVATALNALSNIGAAGVVGSGGPLGTAGVVITFSGTAMANNPYAVMTVDNSLATGGTATVAETTPGATGFTISGSYIPTSVAANVVLLPETKDAKITKNSNVVANDIYGTGFAPDRPGIARGTWTFMQNAIDDTIYWYQRNQMPLHFALYETVKVPAGAPPGRIWLMAGYPTQTPVDLTVAAMEGGSVQGTLLQWPVVCREAL